MTLPLTLRHAVRSPSTDTIPGKYDPARMMLIGEDGTPIVDVPGAWSASTITKTGAEGEKTDLDLDLE